MNHFEREPALPLRLLLDDQPGPAARLSRDRVAAMIDAAMLDFDASSPSRRSANVNGASRRRWLQTISIAAGALLAMAGAAAAARFYFHFDEPSRAPLAPPTAVTPIPPQSAHALLAPEPIPAPEDDAVPAVAPPPRAASKSARASAPEDLLQKANRLRSDAQFREAALTYSQVYERFPKSSSAYVARVAAAAIELEHLSNPTAARRLFEQALRDQPSGALDLEARQGLSVALRDLEDRPGEVRALRSLVEAHPDSPAARRAQVRMRELHASVSDAP
ncbi:MAG TPA: hypothetical protein VGI70_17290 [Polyangiales bacterium]